MPKKKPAKSNMKYGPPSVAKERIEKAKEKKKKRPRARITSTVIRG